MRSWRILAPARRPLVYALAGAIFAIAAVNQSDLRGPLGACDIDQAWAAGRALLEHENPYRVIGPGAHYNFPWTLYYPLTVGVVALPLAVFPFEVARALFLLVCGGVFGYAVGAKRAWAWPLILSAPFVNAVRTVQWSPLLAAGLMLPAWGAISPIKPNLGLALLAGARSRAQVTAMVAGGVVLFGLSLLFRPGWPVEWYAQVHRAGNFDSFLFRPGGFFILAGLLRWRDPDARLLLAMGLVPQTGIWYDALPALLVARNHRQTLVLSVLSQVAFMGSALVTTEDFASGRRELNTLILWGILLPAMVLVLRRGVEWPGWIKRAGRTFGRSESEG